MPILELVENEKKLRVLAAAKIVFLRYGFRRVTMQDIADEAGISRPALYLVFPNKEEVFIATIGHLSGESLATIREKLPTLPDAEAKLRFAFEIWTIYPFELMLASPDARDLAHCGEGFASEVLGRISAEFESILQLILEPVVAANGAAILPAAQVAHLLAASAHGYKDASKSISELREMIHGLITLTLAALEVKSNPRPVSA
ncbi:TetR/AcrR family transcriptional regulator [Acidicapsa ligni]|uniref:TetR/AcrR family transcriptional regulator n=1 Tax=Acidicapsa ligni TaxID=542300 RepID=UPI0021E0A2A9|nr:TetR/AcrR family transcriptional regulator [Acidicapsa ligni]